MLMKNIAVLLAAYNGIEWIDEQVQSILNQKNVCVDIYISVDVSSDDTMFYCKKISDEHDNVNLLPYGERFGDAASNFYSLIKNAPIDSYDYISFSDQDDIWYENKLFNAVKILSSGEYSGYSSDVMAFWNDGRTKVIKKSQKQVKYDYLFESAGPGCSIVINKNIAIRLRQLLIENPEVKNIEYHDWFVYALVRSIGERWYIDNFISMKYRQHEKNQIGANNGWRMASKRILMIKNGWYRRQIKNIADALDLHDDIVHKGVEKNNILSRFYLIANINEIRRKPSERIFLLIMIVFGFF